MTRGAFRNWLFSKFLVDITPVNALSEELAEFIGIVKNHRSNNCPRLPENKALAGNTIHSLKGGREQLRE